MTRVLGALVLSGLAALPIGAREPSLATVLSRAAEYVADFHRQLASIVAEERYVQDWKSVSQGRVKETRDLAHRELLSDLLLVKPDGFRAYMEFRDVFAVDGAPVRERDQRLEKLFLEPSSSTDGRIRAILAESARYNIGDLERNVNTPIFPLLFLEAPNGFRFKFKRSQERTPATVHENDAPADGAFRVSTEVWVIAFEEKASHTMIRTDGTKDLPSKGRFWIDPATGRVLMSELRVENRAIRATIDVSYQSEPLMGVLVPVEMRERYETVGRNRNSLIEGRATYGKFRQFQVKTNETLKK